MSIVVTDTGPLNYLVLIDLISLLPTLFGTVAIAEAVKTELETRKHRLWFESGSPCRHPGSSPTCPSQDRDQQRNALGYGERASIKLAMTLNADLLLMDDRAAVIIARARGLEVTGTLGVLDRAADRGFVELAESFSRLRATSFRVRPALLDQLLALHLRRHGKE